MSFLEGFTEYKDCAPAGVKLPEINIEDRYYKQLKLKNSTSNYDFLRALCLDGVKKKGIDYYARLPDRQKRSREASSGLGKDIFGNPASERRSVSVAETAAQRRARLKQEALAKRKAEGQIKRKKFYKEKGERLARLKAKLLNLV